MSSSSSPTVDEIGRANQPLLVHFDGGYNPGTGEARIGYIIEDLQGTKIAKESRPIDAGTSNKAELKALKAAVGHCRSLNADQVRIRGDCDEIIKRVNGHLTPSKPEVEYLVEQVKTALLTFTSTTLEYVPREENEQADSLATTKRG